MTEPLRPSLMVCTPCFGRSVTATFMDSVLRLQVACYQSGVDFRFVWMGSDALITRVRAELAARFLDDAQATHMLFIDADIGFEPEQVFRLLRFNADISAAAYPIKEIAWDRVVQAALDGRDVRRAGLNYVTAWSESRVTARNDFARVRYAGTGFLMIRREALEKLRDAHPDLRYRRVHYAGSDAFSESQNRYALFDTMIDPVTGEYLSEDFAFCRRWTDLGGEIWLDLRSKLSHMGQQEFAGDLMQILTPVRKQP